MTIVVVKQHKTHTHQKKKSVLTCKFTFYYQAGPNFVAKSMVEINPSLIGQLISRKM